MKRLMMGLIILLAACGGEEPEQQILPTIVEFPTLEDTATAAPSATSSATDLPTDIPSATETVAITETATYPPDSDWAQNATAQNRLDGAFNEIAGINEIAYANADPLDDNRWLVAMEVYVLPGLNTVDMAEALQQATFRRLVTASVDFSVLIDDTRTATDYVWNNRRDEWIITPIRFLTATSTITDTPRPANTAAPENTTIPTRPPASVMYVDSDARVRAEPNTQSSIVANVPSGEQVQAFGTVSGEFTLSSSNWIEVEVSGVTGYIHSALLSSNPPVVAAPVQSSTNSGSTSSGGSTSGAWTGRTPENCSDAVAMGLTAQQAAQYSHLDRDKDGVACYGD